MPAASARPKFVLFVRLLVLAAALAALATAAGPSLAADPAPSVFLSPSGSDSGSCTSAAPCRSLDRAYHAAQPGQLVELAGGSYPAQTINPDSTKTSAADVIFRPASGASVNVANLEVHGSHLEIRGINFPNFSWRAWTDANDLTFRNDTAPKFDIVGASNVSVIGGTYGPMNDTSNQIAPESATDTTVPTNIVIDGVTIHGFHRVDPTAHVDCIHSWGVNGLTIRNSRFYDCEAFDILFTLDSAWGSPTNVLIENNFLDCCRSGFYSVYLGDQHGERWSNFTIRNNSTNKTIGIGTANTTVANLNFYGNIAPAFEGCGRPGVTADYNVWYSGSKCGANDQVAPSGFVNPAAFDFHLTAGAAAIDHGEPGGPATDIDGQARPAGIAPDAGADEYGAGMPTTAAPVNSSPPTISGTAQQGQVLTASNGTWSDTPTFGYQWRACDSAGAGCVAIAGATAKTYTLSAGEVGDTVRVVVTASNAGGSNSATSAQTVVVSGASVPPPSGSGLVAAYGFNEGSGTAVADSSGNGNGGSISGAVWNPAGHAGSALSFDGLSSWVTVPDSASLDLTTGMTLEAWVKPAALAGWDAVLNKETTGDVNYALIANSDTNTPAGIVNFDGANEQIDRGAAQLPLNVWTHLATSFDGTTLRLYVNGTQVSSMPTSGSIVTSAGVLRIGGNSIWGEYFNGLIDDVRVYNRALSASEIGSDMSTPVGGASMPSNTALPVVSGTAQQGQVVTTSNGSWSNAPTGYGYQWRACDSGGATCANIGGATAKSYTLSAGEVGDTIRAVVTASNTAGSSSSTSAQTGSVSPLPAPSGLVAAYGFNEGSGTAVADSSGRGNGGSITGAAWNPAGHAGSALSFDGLGNYVTVADSASLDLTTGMTLEAWVKPVTVTGWQAVINKETIGDIAYGLLSSSDQGYPTGVVNFDGMNESLAYGPTQLPLNAWSHLSATFDGSTLRLYVNGSQVASLAAAGSMVTSANPLKIGGNAIWGEYFNGLIDDVRVYNRALSASEIGSDMSTPVGGSVPPPGPVAAPVNSSPPTISGTAQQGQVLTASNGTWSDTPTFGYQWRACDSAGANCASIAGATAKTYTLSAGEVGDTVRVVVTASNAGGSNSATSAQTAVVSGATAPPPPPPPPPPPSGSASLFLSPSGSDSSSCSQSAPCKTLNHAYQVASLGQIVELAGGSYSGETITGTKSGTGRVVYRPASGATVSIGSLTLDANHIEVSDMKIGDYSGRPGSSDLVFRRISTGFFFFRSSSNVSILGGSVGGIMDVSPTIGTYAGMPSSSNFLLDGVLFHDIHRSPGNHIECLFVQETIGITIRNSKFTQCDVMDVYFNDIVGGGAPSNVTVENSMFDTPSGGGYPVYVRWDPGDVMSNYLFRNNSLADSLHFDPGTYVNTRVIGNAGFLQGYSCVSGITYVDNVWSNAQCSSTDKLANPGFKNVGAFDLHLAAGSPAINAGDSASFPATDIDGQTRPMGGAPDAGADEAG